MKKQLLAATLAALSSHALSTSDSESESVHLKHCFDAEICSKATSTINYEPAHVNYGHPEQCPSLKSVLDGIELTKLDEHLDGSHESLVVAIKQNLDKFNLASGTHSAHLSLPICASNSNETTCDAQLCIDYPDKWPPRSVLTCPSYESINQISLNKTYHSHLKDPFDQEKWSKLVDRFIAWGDQIENFPCVVDQIDKSRCDTLEVVAKDLGEMVDKPVENISEANIIESLRQIDQPTEEELTNLKQLANSADLTLENPFPSAGTTCTKCIHAKRVLKEWRSEANCSVPNAAPQCVGSEECAINHCVSWVPMNLFKATWGAHIHYLSSTDVTKRILLQDDDDHKHPGSVIIELYDSTSSTEPIDIHFEDIAVLTSDNRRDWLVTQIQWQVDGVASPWVPFLNSHVKLPSIDAKTTLTFNVRTWSACGLVTSQEFELTIYRNFTPVSSQFLDIFLKDDGRYSTGLILFGVVICTLAATWASSKRHEDLDASPYLLVEENSF